MIFHLVILYAIENVWYDFGLYERFQLIIMAA